MEQELFWQNPEEAKEVISQVKKLKEWILPFTSARKRLEAVSSVWVEAQEMQDAAFIQELTEELQQVALIIQELELRQMLSGEMDLCNCYLSINSGAGGTEACDWALMLSRMYQRWATKRGWLVEILDVVDGDVAGIKSITYKFSGPFAYGYAKAERGVHRLVRISPFDANGKRHTSFASVDVVPEVSEDIEIEVNMEEVRVDTYRSSGAGGQHVNKTDSAVRMTHIPTGIVVSCQQGRSQVQNRESCLEMLKAQLYEHQRKKQKEKIEGLAGEKMSNSFSSQIRNYVFQPYTLVKDTRTGVEIGDIQKVMDGEIDPFIIAYLKEFGCSG